MLFWGRRDRQTARQERRKWESGVGSWRGRRSDARSQGQTRQLRGPGPCATRRVQCSVALAGREALGDSQQPPASSLSGGREPGTRMDRWRLADGCRHSRLSTLDGSREREAGTGRSDGRPRDGSTVLGPTYLRGCLFGSGWLIVRTRRGCPGLLWAVGLPPAPAWSRVESRRQLNAVGLGSAMMVSRDMEWQSGGLGQVNCPSGLPSDYLDRGEWAAAEQATWTLFMRGPWFRGGSWALCDVHFGNQDTWRFPRFEQVLNPRKHLEGKLFRLCVTVD